MNCPKCGAPAHSSARYCTNCGQLLSYVAPRAPVATIQRVSAPEVPRRETSVLRALLPGRMPSGAFWAGLVLLTSGLVFGLCTAATSMALMLGSTGGAEVLLVSACGLAVLVVPGLALLLAGRPRRRG